MFRMYLSKFAIKLKKYYRILDNLMLLVVIKLLVLYLKVHKLSQMFLFLLRIHFKLIFYYLNQDIYVNYLSSIRPNFIYKCEV